MNRKVTYLLGTVFVALLVVTTQPYWQEYVSQDLIEKKSDVQTIAIPSDVSKITLNLDAGEREVTLYREGGDWFVGDQKAVDLALMSTLLADLESLSIDSVASRNPDKFQSFDASDSGTIIRLENTSGETADLVVGSNGVQAGTIYLRPLDKNEVYIVRSKLNDASSRALDDWRDKNVFMLNQDDLDSITLNKAGKTLTIDTNEQDQWTVTMAQDKRVMGDVARDRFFDSLDPFEGRGFANEEQRLLFERSFNPVTVDFTFTSSGEPLSLVLVEDTNNSVWLASTSETEEVYTVSPSTVTVLVDNTFTLFE